MNSPAFVVHDLGQAKAAIRAARERNRRVCLMSAPGAAAQLGPAMWREMMAEAERAEPGVLEAEILDCGSDPGWALAALREGVRAIAVDVADEVRAKIEDIAGQLGATVLPAMPAPSCDLAVADPLAAAREWLSHD